MVKPHIMIVASANFVIERQIEILLRSIEDEGQCNDYYCTIIIQDHEQLSSKFLKDRCDFHCYSSDLKFLYPWSSSPRWNVIPKSPLCVFLDFDVVCAAPLLPFIDFCMEQVGVCASLAIKQPFDYRPLAIWKYLFAKLGVGFPKDLYEYKFGDLKSLGPFYFNHGVVGIQAASMESIKECYYDILNRLNLEIKDNYFLVQIAAAIATSKIKGSHRLLPSNYHEFCNLEMSDDVILFHYNACRDEVKLAIKQQNFSHITDLKLRNLIEKHSTRILWY